MYRTRNQWREQGSWPGSFSMVKLLIWFEPQIPCSQNQWLELQQCFSNDTYSRNLWDLQNELKTAIGTTWELVKNPIVNSEKWPHIFKIIYQALYKLSLRYKESCCYILKKKNINDMMNRIWFDIISMIWLLVSYITSFISKYLLNVCWVHETMNK